MFVGFRSFDTNDPLLPNYSGLVADVEANYRARATRFDVRVQRDVDYSAEEIEPYYLLTDAGLKVTQKITHRWDVVGMASRQWLDYRRIEGLGALGRAVACGPQLPAGRRRGLLSSATACASASTSRTTSGTRRSSLREYDGLRVGGSFTYGLTQQ